MSREPKALPSQFQLQCSPCIWSVAVDHPSGTLKAISGGVCVDRALNYMGTQATDLDGCVPVGMHSELMKWGENSRSALADYFVPRMSCGH